MTAINPVTDWATDFDLFDPAFVTDPYPTWQVLRGICPVAHTERWGGSHMPSTFETVTAVAHDSDSFSSIEVTVAPMPESYDESGERLRSIIATDAPDHKPQRQLMLPFFAPRAIERFREPTRDLCRQLIRGFVERGSVDAAEEYAKQVPPRVIAEILGIDPARGDDFAEWVRGALEIGLTDPVAAEKYSQIIDQFFLEEIERRQTAPGDDLISHLLAAELDGEPVPMPVVRGNVSLMLIAGIDTTWSSIGSALWHLASHPEDRRRLVAEPALIPVAVEEFLRAYSPVTMARIAAHDAAIGDHEVKAGERVLLSFPAANRDPDAFENAEDVVIDRQVNRHVAFGAGAHRCLGSNLARMEMVVAIEEFLAMIPKFELTDADAVTWAGGQVRGPRNLSISFAPPSI